jgi:nucleotide-binding universal stress UspA family protein
MHDLGRFGAQKEARRRTGAAGTVIVGVDTSALSDAVVDLAAFEAELRGCALRIVHAGGEQQPARLLERLTERVRTASPDVAVSARMTVGMDTSDLLLTDAAPHDLIVVGHRHGALRGVLRRGVADRVAARHPGPVLVVRNEGWSAGSEPVICPLVVRADGVAATERAAEFAVCEARLRGCDVELLHVIDEPEDVPDRTERRRGVNVRHRRVAGKPVTELAEASLYACAVVLGRGTGGRPLDAVSRAVLHRARCPVFVAG